MKLLCFHTAEDFLGYDFGSNKILHYDLKGDLGEKLNIIRDKRADFDYFVWMDDRMLHYFDDQPIIHFFDNIAEKEIHYFEFDFSWPVDGSDIQHIILATRESLVDLTSSVLIKNGNLNNLNLVFHRNLCLKKRILHFLGDSHILNNYTDSDYIFSKCHILFDSYVEGFDLAFTHWIGARTMYSISQGNELENMFNEFLIKENDVCVLSFGEIDVRAHVIKQRDVQNRKIEEIVLELAANFISTVQQIISNPQYSDLKMIISGVIPPINQKVEGTDQIETYGTIEEIVYASKTLNKNLKKMCDQNMYYFDVYEEYSNADGTLNMEKSDYFCHISRSHNQPILKKLNQFIKAEGL